MSSPTDTPFRELPLDRAAEGSVAALRIAAAAVVSLAALWLLAGSWPPLPWMWAFAGLAVIASIAWVGMGMGGRRRVADAGRHRVVLDADGVTLEAGVVRRTVAWRDVRGIETDEERLVVRVSVLGEDDLVLEPRYGGLGAYDLEAAVRRAADHARS